MIDTATIKHLPRKDKLRVMNLIWEYLSAEKDPIESTSWHQDALMETENNLRCGHERIIEWTEAKKDCPYAIFVPPQE